MLIACETCGREVADEAKSCPHCGARKRRPVWIVNISLGIVLLALVAFVIYRVRTVNNLFPDCTSRSAASDFKRTFDGSQYARTLNLTAIDVVGQRTISNDTASTHYRRICQATLLLNNTRRMAYRFTITPAPHGGYYIEGRQTVR